ncbi:MAG: ABC transporter permease [Thermoanaerobaculia bacterium]
MISHVRLALKVLGRRKFFTFISLFGITLTLVVLMVATAILDNVFAPRQPESRFDRVLMITTLGIYGPHFGRTAEPGFGFIERYVKGLPGAEETSAFTTVQSSAIFDQGVRIPTYVRWTDGAYWRVLDFQFVEGGPFSAADDEQANFVVVISDDLRQKLFGDEPALGRTIAIDGRGYRVTGVVPPVAISRAVAFSEMWMPIGTMKGNEFRRQTHGDFNAIVLASSPRDFERLRSELAARLDRFVFDDPKQFDRVVAGLDTPFEAVARQTLGNQVEGRAAILRTILVGVALLFLALPTMNLVSINLSRILERAPEIGVRKSFGASSGALVRQFILENVVLTLAGGALGFALTVLVLRGLAAADFLPHSDFEVNLRVFGYALLITLGFGVVSGVYPAWRMSRLHPVDALRGGAQ